MFSPSASARAFVSNAPFGKFDSKSPGWIASAASAVLSRAM